MVALKALGRKHVRIACSCFVILVLHGGCSTRMRLEGDVDEEFEALHERRWTEADFDLFEEVALH